jgi:hypothetical protein
MRCKEPADELDPVNPVSAGVEHCGVSFESGGTHVDRGESA